MDPEKKGLNLIFPTKYVIPKSLSRLAIGQVSWFFVDKNQPATWHSCLEIPLPPGVSTGLELNKNDRFLGIIWIFGMLQ